MEKIYTLYGCGYEYTTESKLRKSYERNKKNCPNGWANEYKNFEDFIAKSKANHTLVEF